MHKKSIAIVKKKYLVWKLLKNKIFALFWGHKRVARIKLKWFVKNYNIKGGTLQMSSVKILLNNNKQANIFCSLDWSKLWWKNNIGKCAIAKMR